ncbi:MAG: alpha/beta hydrolase [Anaerolineae bacterium]|nr:alpha/beta hydrolase [Anaerolineae bacterium]
MGKLPTEYLDLGDVKIAYREQGAGPVLILLHGNSGSKDHFSSYQQLHFKAFRTIAVDSRGHGETISNDTSYSINQYSDDVIRFCKAKDIHQAAVVGYSDGGNIALFLAKKEPTIFTRIVAISPNYLVGGSTDGSLRLFNGVVKLFRILGRLGLPTRKALMRFDLMLNDIGITAEELRGIQTSMRILYAEKDMIKEEHILEMGSLIPGVTVKKIGRCNHLTILHKQEAIDDIKDYLNR